MALAGLALLAFVVRLLPVLLHGGLGFIGRYDDGVYYAAADALSFGRVPYRQFILLHPPGIMLVLLPFAALGRITTDLAGVEVARLAFMALGAANTVLVAVIARRWGRPAMLVAGLVYACWQPAVFAEQSTFLEPVGGLLVLLALYRLIKTDGPPTARAELVSGLCLGGAALVKIWYVAPLATIVAWQLLRRQPKSAARLLVASVGTVAAVVVPFAIAAGHPMNQMVLRDQLFRPIAVPARSARFASLLGVGSLTGNDVQLRHLLVVLLSALLVVVFGAAITDRATRPLFAILAVNATVLIVSPVYLRHYAAFIAGPAALLVGVGVARLYVMARLRPAATAATGLIVATCVASAVRIGRVDDGRSFPAARFTAAAPAGCIAADDPLALAEIDRLSTDLRDGCPVKVDVTGAVLDRFTVVYPSGVLVPRRFNPGWQQYLYRYLTSARAFIVCREPSDGMNAAYLQSYRRFPVIASAFGGHDLMRLGRAGHVAGPD